MERTGEIYTDGCIYEIEGDQAVRISKTQGKIEGLLCLL